MQPLIQVSGLTYRYPDGTQALRGVDFTLGARETVAVLGPNGSGKTTFLLRLMGLLKGDGEVQVCGQRLEKSTLTFIRQKVGLLFQDSDDQLFMPTVAEDVAFGPLNMGLEAAEVSRRVRQALELVGMQAAASRAPYHLSAGEKHRVALAGVLATDPEIILLDEPASFLDPPARSSLLATLRDLPQAKLIVTHDLTLARELASRAVFFEQGKIVAEGGVEDVIERFQWDMSSVVRRP